MRRWAPTWTNDDCGVCEAYDVTVDADGMCRECFYQAADDDWAYQREQEAIKTAAMIAEREEESALAAVRRSMDVLNKS